MDHTVYNFFNTTATFEAKIILGFNSDIFASVVDALKMNMI